MKVGDIVLAIRNQKKFPGKIIEMINNKTFLVKFYQIKNAQKITAKDIQHFTSEVARRQSQKSGWKKISLAIKQAQKEYNSLLANMTDDKDGNLTSINHNSSLQFEVKEQEQNCKQEQDGQQKQESQILYYETFIDFLIAQNELAIIEDCKQNKPKEYLYLCSKSKQIKSVVKLPKYSLIIQLSELLHLIYGGKCNKQKLAYQKKVVSILNSNHVTFQDCLNSKLMKWVSLNIDFYETNSSFRKQEQQYFLVLHEFHSNFCRNLEEHLDDYSDIADLAINLSLLMTFGLQDL